MLEGRREPRRLTLETGVISSSELAADIGCAILDISERGATILVPAGAVVPDTFNLAIDPDRGSHACQVAWSAASRLGISFRAAALPGWRFRTGAEERHEHVAQ
jgi:PilZ domain